MLNQSIHTEMQAKLINLDEYLNLLSTEDLRQTAKWQGIETMERRDVLTNVPHQKARLVELCIEAEEKEVAKRNGCQHFTMSVWGKEMWAGLPLRELKISARSLGVTLTERTFKNRLVSKTDQKLRYELMYETNLFEIF